MIADQFDSLLQKTGPIRIGYLTEVKIAVLGASGAVGQAMVQVLADEWPTAIELFPLASERSLGSVVEFRGQKLPMAVPSRAHLSNCDVVFASAGKERSLIWAPIALEGGGWFIDNSSAFRMNADVPLVVAEINMNAIGQDHRLIANPNCTAMILLMAVAPLHRRWPIDRLTVSTYQSASGAGAAAMQELLEQTSAVLRGEEAKPKVFPHPYAFNLFSHNTPIDASGSNDEEIKVAQECRKILDEPNLKINVTCVRVPVLRAHSIAINIEFRCERPSVEDAKSVLAEMPGVRLVDDPASNHFPMPIEASGQRDVLVGRVRLDPSHEKGMNMFVCGDQLLKGAALNAVQIALNLLQEGRISERVTGRPTAAESAP